MFLIIFLFTISSIHKRGINEYSYSSKRCRHKKIFEKGLKEAGYSVEDTSDWEDAYYHAVSGNYELIILDTVIGDKTGIELCEKIRKREY